MSDDPRRTDYKDPFPLYTDNANAMTFAMPNPDPFCITFPGNSVIRFWKDGRCEFEGNPDEAAKSFYEHVVKAHVAYMRGDP
jgi:hypothetical protein